MLCGTVPVCWALALCSSRLSRHTDSFLSVGCKCLGNILLRCYITTAAALCCGGKRPKAKEGRCGACTEFLCWRRPQGDCPVIGTVATLNL